MDGVRCNSDRLNPVPPLRRMMRKPGMVCLLLVFCLACIPGCMTQPGEPASPAATPVETPGPAAELSAGPHPSFDSSVVSLQKHYRTDGSCYWVATAKVTNTGDVAGSGVVVRFKLVDDESGSIRSTGTEFLSRFGARDTKQFTRELNGECDRSYHLEIETLYDIS